MSSALASSNNTTAQAQRAAGRRLSLGYAGLCLLCWLLYAMAGTEWQRGAWRLWEAAYEATLNLWAPMLLGGLVFPWVRWLQPRPLAQRVLLHGTAALLFGVAWQALEFAIAWLLFEPAHAWAQLQQRLLWRAVFGVFVYVALTLGFAGVLHARRAQASALAAAQAESALVRAELAAISGRLNPHFLFNTLNTLLALTRKDAAAAEDALLRFARLMRYVLDTQRANARRVSLRDELDFVRDYLALEALRLGTRLRVEWDIDEHVQDETLPPLTLQPLVENSIAHAIAPRVRGGCVRIGARASTQTGVPDEVQGMTLTVADDGAGCVWPLPASAPTPSAPSTPGPASSARGGGGVGLEALSRRFALDYAGQARLQIHTAPGAGFRVEIFIPFETAA
jgi:signal transduction histidine kinase